MNLEANTVPTSTYYWRMYPSVGRYLSHLMGALCPSWPPKNQIFGRLWNCLGAPFRLTATRAKGPRQWISSYTIQVLFGIIVTRLLRLGCISPFSAVTAADSAAFSVVAFLFCFSSSSIRRLRCSLSLSFLTLSLAFLFVLFPPPPPALRVYSLLAAILQCPKAL